MRTYIGEDEDDVEESSDRDIRALRRTSHRRVMRCERNLRRISRSYKSTLQIDESHRTAHIDMERDPSHAVVSGRQFEQPVTDYTPLAWDWLCQRVLTAHEAAHARYTDHDDFMERLDQYKAHQKGFVKHLWNASEDCAIEAHLRRAIPAYDDLIAAFRANLMESSTPEDGSEVSLASATSMAILEKGTYDSGRVKTLLNPREKGLQFASDDDRETFVNEIAPHIDDLLQDILEEPNAQKRNERIFEFIEQVREPIENADNPDNDVDEGEGDNSGESPDQPPQNNGEQEGDNGGQNDEGEQEGEQGGGESEEESDDEQDEDERGGGSGEGQSDEEGEQQGGGDGESDEQPDSEQEGPAGMPNDADNMNGSGEADDADELNGANTDENGNVAPPSGANDVTTDPDVQQDLQNDVESEGDNLPTPDSGGRGSSNESVENDRIDRERDEPARLNSATWDSAMTEADRLQRVLEDLTASDKSRRNRHQRRGRIDGSSLHRVKTGEKRVKMRQEKPDDPDMGFVLVIDRSGSMDGSLISSAEQAAIGFAAALERVGIDVMVLSLYNGRVRQDLGFNESVEQNRADLANGETSGGTPLSDALEMARKRIRNENLKERRVLVISDDRPASPSQYKREVRKCSFPVVGILLSNAADLDDYTRATESAPDGSTLSADLQKLARELVHST